MSENRNDKISAVTEWIREELEKICGMMPHEISVPEVTVCRYFNDSNLIGALYVHLNAE